MTDKNKGKSIKELLDAYGVNRATFMKWINPIQHKLRYREEKRRILTPKEVQYIYDFLDSPST